MGIRSLALLATAAAAACVSSPEVPTPGSGRPHEQVYADVLLNYNADGKFGVCRAELPECDVPLEMPCNEVGRHAWRSSRSRRPTGLPSRSISMVGSMSVSTAAHH
jgi:hypothetical protein